MCSSDLNALGRSLRRLVGHNLGDSRLGMRFGSRFFMMGLGRLRRPGDLRRRMGRFIGHGLYSGVRFGVIVAVSRRHVLMCVRAI